MNQKVMMALLCCFVSVSAYAGVKCSDLIYGNDSYHDNMDKLARLARLPEQYWNKYHEEVVTDLCSGNEKSVQQMINDGSVKRSEVEGIREVLGLEKRSSIGKTYGYSREKFIDMGLCNACADNVAQYYSQKPYTQCGILAKQALEGNPQATEKLKTFPNFCTWKY